MGEAVEECSPLLITINVLVEMHPTSDYVNKSMIATTTGGGSDPWPASIRTASSVILTSNYCLTRRAVGAYENVPQTYYLLALTIDADIICWTWVFLYQTRKSCDRITSIAHRNETI